MRPPPKNRIDTQAAVSAQPGLNAAFAQLNLGGLPPGPDTPPPAPAAPPRPARLGRVVLRRETAHRGGKTVIVLDGFSDQLSEEFLSALGKKLRAACGSGGTQRDRVLEIQGEHAPTIRELLAEEGFQVAGVK